MKHHLSFFSLFILWFGAAVSIAEILVGALLGPLGLFHGFLAIILGHFVGCSFLAFAGLIGFRENKTATQTARISLGKQGSYVVSFFNILQLLGWSAIMLIQASNAMQIISESFFGIFNFNFYVIFLGFLVLVWSILLEKGSHILNEISVIFLIFLCILIFYKFLQYHTILPFKEIKQKSLTFGDAFELSLIMPLSWTPLISDYTRKGKSKYGSFWGSYTGYFLGSSLMYSLGLICSAELKNNNFSAILMGLKLGYWSIFVVVLSTVSTLFLDLYSTVISTHNIFPTMNKIKLTLFYSILGTIIALFFPMENYEDFLYIIGAIFTPTFTIIFVDYFVLKRNYEKKIINILGIISILNGVIFYYWFKKFSLPTGPSLPTILITSSSYYIFFKISFIKIKSSNKNS